MTAALALKSARAIGIRVRVDGEDLELEAPAPPPQAVLDLLFQHKADVLRLLRRPMTAGRQRIGRSFSTSAQPSSSSMVVACLGRSQKRARLPPV